MQKYARGIYTNYLHYFQDNYLGTSYFEDGIKDLKGKPMVRQKEYKEIAETFYALVFTRICYEGRAFLLKDNLGYIQNYKSKRHPDSTRPKPINFKLFHDSGDYLPYSNMHTNQEYAYTRWVKKPESAVGVSRAFRGKASKPGRYLTYDNIMNGQGIEIYIRKR